MKAMAILQQRPWLVLVMAMVLLVAYWLVREPSVDTDDTPTSVPMAAPATVPAQPVAPEAPTGPSSVAGETAGLPQSPGPDAASAAPATSVDLFAVRDWAPPPPVVDTTPTPPPEPEAPPLPFRYLGKLDEPGKAVIFFLARDDKILAVSTGDVIDGIYRVGKQEGGQLTFLYRPLKIRQSLSLGSEP